MIEEAKQIGHHVTPFTSPVPSPSPSPSREIVEEAAPVEEPPGSAGGATSLHTHNGRGSASGALPIVCALPLSSMATTLSMAPAIPIATAPSPGGVVAPNAEPAGSVDAPAELQKLHDFLQKHGIHGSEVITGWSARKQKSGGVVFTSESGNSYRSMAEAARQCGAMVPSSKRPRE